MRVRAHTHLHTESHAHSNTFANVKPGVFTQKTHRPSTSQKHTETALSLLHAETHAHSVCLSLSRARALFLSRRLSLALSLVRHCTIFANEKTTVVQQLDRILRLRRAQFSQRVVFVCVAWETISRCS